MFSTDPEKECGHERWLQPDAAECREWWNSSWRYDDAMSGRKEMHDNVADRCDKPG
jgi:hypothetical protein